MIPTCALPPHGSLTANDVKPFELAPAVVVPATVDAPTTAAPGLQTMQNQVEMATGDWQQQLMVGLEEKVATLQRQVHTEREHIKLCETKLAALQIDLQAEMARTVFFEAKLATSEEEEAEDIMTEHTVPAEASPSVVSEKFAAAVAMLMATRSER